MGAVLLALLYLASSLGLALLVRGLRREPSLGTTLILTLVPLAYVGGGFLPGKVIAPTNSLVDVSPWADGSLIHAIRENSSTVNPLLLDPLSEFMPWSRAARNDWLFNPAQCGGAALLANGQSAVLFPVEVASRVLPPVRAATYSQAARLLLAVWGMYLLARFLAMADRPALFAALAYSGAGFLQLWRAHPHSYVAACAPWILAALLVAVRRPGGAAAVGLAVVGAVGVYAGHPETLFHVMALGLLFILPALWQHRRRWRRIVIWGVTGAVLAFLLSAPALLPFVENLQVSAEWVKRDQHHFDAVEVPILKALIRLVPAVIHAGWGDPLHGKWIGPENVAELAGGSLGAACFVLLPAAFALRRRRRLAALCLGLGLVGLLVGAHVPWISKPFGWMPLMNMSLLKRLSLWWVLMLSVLVGLAVEALCRGRGRKAVMAGAGLALGLLAGIVSLAPTAREALVWRTEWAPVLVVFVAAFWLTVVRRRGEDRLEGRQLGTRSALALSLLAAALLVPRVELFHRWIPLSTALSFYPEMPAVRFVREQIATSGPAGQRVSGIGAGILPHSGAFFGLEEIRGYDPMTLAAYEGFARGFSKKGKVGWHRLLDLRHPALDYLGVRFFFDHPTAGRKKGLRRVYAEYDAVIYENPGILPRLFVPGSLRGISDNLEALEAARGVADYSAEAVLSGPDEPLGAYPNGRAEVRDLQVASDGRIRASVDAVGEAVVVTSQPAIPGWRARIDGEPAPLLRANGAFLGLRVPAGSHEVEMVYAPSSWRWGLGLAGAGLLLSVVALRRRQPGNASRRRAIAG